MNKGDINLRELLSDCLPKGIKFEVLHLQSFPRRSSNIIRLPNHITIKTLHFVTISRDSIILCGLEVYVYFLINQKNEFDNDDPIRKIVYISKVDSTGLSSGETKVKLTPVIQQILKYILSIKANNYLNFFVDSTSRQFRSKEICTSQRIERLLDSINGTNDEINNNKFNISSLAHSKALVGKKIISEILLFTRAEKQYLFPGSYTNKGKHVLSDRSLLSWWLTLLNNLITDQDTFNIINHCKLTIPGEDKGTILRFINKLSSDKWSLGGIFDKNIESDNMLAVDAIPLFPDDPKGRFLEHLVVEGRIKKIKTRRFWKELAIRQEFRLANIVGLISIKGTSINNTIYKPNTNYDREKYNVKHVNGVDVLNLTTSDLKDLHIKLNNFDDKDIIVLTNKRLKFLKRFIIGEDYGNSFTAKNAYINVNYLLAGNFNNLYKMGKLISNADGTNGFQEIIGRLDYATLKKETPKDAKIDTKTILVLTVKKVGNKKRRVSLNNN